MVGDIVDPIGVQARAVDRLHPEIAAGQLRVMEFVIACRIERISVTRGGLFLPTRAVFT
jgi:hypothetical protein